MRDLAMMCSLRTDFLSAMGIALTAYADRVATWEACEAVLNSAQGRVAEIQLHSLTKLGGDSIVQSDERGNKHGLTNAVSSENASRDSRNYKTL